MREGALPTRVKDEGLRERPLAHALGKFQHALHGTETCKNLSTFTIAQHGGRADCKEVALDGAFGLLHLKALHDRRKATPDDKMHLKQQVCIHEKTANVKSEQFFKRRSECIRQGCAAYSTKNAFTFFFAAERVLRSPLLKRSSMRRMMSSYLPEALLVNPTMYEE